MQIKRTIVKLILSLTILRVRSAVWAPISGLKCKLRGKRVNRGGLGASGITLCWSWDPEDGRWVAPKE